MMRGKSELSLLPLNRFIFVAAASDRRLRSRSHHPNRGPVAAGAVDPGAPGFRPWWVGPAFAAVAAWTRRLGPHRSGSGAVAVAVGRTHRGYAAGPVAEAVRFAAAAARSPVAPSARRRHHRTGQRRPSRRHRPMGTAAGGALQTVEEIAPDERVARADRASDPCPSPHVPPARGSGGRTPHHPDWVRQRMPGSRRGPRPRPPGPGGRAGRE